MAHPCHLPIEVAHGENHVYAISWLQCKDKTKKLLNKQKIVKLELRFQSVWSWPMMPSFVYIAISGLLFVVLIKTCKLELIYIPIENADFQKSYRLPDLPFLKMFPANQIFKISGWNRFFSKWSTKFLSTNRLKTWEIRIL